MAATPFDPSHLGTNPFDIYNDAAIIKNNAPLLPGGSCNFVDISPGANGARCGCRRFWSRCSLGNGVSDQTHWCMCNHHACYHEDGARDGQLPETNIPGQENEKPRTGREPLSPVMDITIKTPVAVPGMDFPSFISPGGALSFIHNKPEEMTMSSAAIANSRPGGSMPDTLAWENFIQSQPGANALPPIPSQCLMPSQTASTTSSAQARYLRPFAGKGLQTLSGATGPKPRSTPQDNAPDTKPPVERQGPPAQADSFVFVTQDDNMPDTLRPDSPTQAEPRAQQTSQSAVSRRAFKNLADTVSGHEQRLDRLETVSFSAPGHDECHDKHDHTDVRITELEGRVEEVERMVNDNGSVISRSSRNDNASVVSVSTNATSRPAHSQELYSQVQSLQAQVVQLQAMMPSTSHPWEVEVVFLPFPLKKIWQEGHHFKSEPMVSSDEWTQLPMTHSTGTLRSQSPFYGDWVSQDHDTEWLFPKACGDKSMINKRLQSRGLVKTVMVRGSDARSVNLAINTAFGGVFREMQLYPRAQVPDSRTSTFLGLQSTWVPLRKIHKDSRLRFLSPAEMMTPATWDVPFLSSVMMRSSEPRLFVTHPDAYLQDFQAYETGWTWQRLKEAHRVHVDSQGLPTVPEAESEDIWHWNEQLDEPLSAQITMAPPERRTVSSSPSMPFVSAIQTFRSSSPMANRAQSPLLKGRRGSRPPHIRTSSMPIAGPVQNSPLSARRRVASYGQSRRSSPAIRTSSQSAIMKRRRTRSPSHARFTPRWTASPSPMPMGITDRQAARGTTPFAYATPYSNAPLQEVRTVRGGSVAHNVAMYESDVDPEDDIEIFESDSDDDLYNDDDESVGSVEIVAHAQLNPEFSSQRWYLPEDEPWPGIEDQDRLSDGENIDPRESDHSNVSSQPSEYPSTQSAWPGDDNVGFQIHEDDENRP